jgi:hypothetical protein
MDNKDFFSEIQVGGQGTVAIFLIREDFFFIQKGSDVCPVRQLYKPPTQIFIEA